MIDSVSLGECEDEEDMRLQQSYIINERRETKYQKK
jgi:hypothetical protein